MNARLLSAALVGASTLVWILFLLLLVPVPPAHAACSSSTGCRVQPVYGRAPCDDEVPGLIAPVCQNNFGASNGPTIATIKTGTDGSTRITASMPCLLFKSMVFVESSWQMFCASSCGSQGLTLIGGGCGYGYSQITSGMRASDLANNTSTNFDVNRVANSATYNLATGLQFMVDKWNGRAAIGTRDPDIIEHWYYAAWAYNSFSWVNNPNNPNYPAGRKPFYCEGGLSRANYPYQEAVWGYMRCPPSRSGKAMWTGAPISYPKTSEICATSGCAPGALSNPLPNHKDPCQKGASGEVYDPDAIVDSDGDGTPDSEDCAPQNAAIRPGATERCNALDDDCDGWIDEGTTLCPASFDCIQGQCVAQDVPDAGNPDEADAGDLIVVVPDTGTPEPAPDTGAPFEEPACLWLFHCPDGYLCQSGRCIQDPVVNPDPPDAGEPENAMLPAGVWIVESSGCGCQSDSASSAPWAGLPCLLMGLGLLCSKRRARPGRV
ncbi:MAG: putative metal-binding motif-containing protein [Myxococcales bacterium]|jgi:hypothetical protein|nr:putative metal-binding motif-containing protein [Myxococcales bacterium]